MELIWILGVIRRRKWIIVQSFISITLVAFLGSFLISPSYESTSKIMVKISEKPASGSGSGNIGFSSLSSILTFAPSMEFTKVQAVSSPYINQMASQLQLRDDEGNIFPAAVLIQTGIIYALKGVISPKPNIAIAPYMDTDALLITATSPNADEAMMMASTLGEIMVAESQAQLRAEYGNAKLYLENEIEKVKHRYRVALNSLTNFKKEEKTVDLAEETKQAIAKMGELLKQKEDNIINLAEAHAKLERLKQELARQNLNFVAPTSMVTNPQIEAIKRRLSELQLQLSEATSKLTEKHPLVISLRDQIKTANAELKKELDTHRISAPELVALERDIAALEAQIKEVNADIEKNTTLLAAIPERASGQTGVDTELNASQRVYSSLLDYLYQVGVAETTTLSGIQVLDPAVRPLYPTSPNKILNTLVGMFLGVFFGFGLTFLIEYLDDVVRTTDDLKGYKPISVIVTIPKLPRKRKAFAGEMDPADPFYESYRKLRTHLKYIDTISEKPLKSLLVTSPGFAEGKSNVVSNLGICMARDGRRVLLVDAHLARPSLHSYFELPNGAGVSNILEGKASVDNAVQTTRFAGLNVLTSGPPPDNPDSLIESDAMARMISESSSHYDMIIVDSAPLLINSDSLILAKRVDASIVALESGKTPRHAVQQMMALLDNTSVTPLGFILNKFSLNEGYHYHHYYYGNKSLLTKGDRKKRS